MTIVRTLGYTEENMPGDKAQELCDRITHYLWSGGLFNPELAMHDRVRDLLIECREVLKESTNERTN